MAKGLGFANPSRAGMINSKFHLPIPTRDEILYLEICRHLVEDVFGWAGLEARCVLVGLGFEAVVHDGAAAPE